MRVRRLAGAGLWATGFGCALVLAVAALLVALQADPGIGPVSAATAVADWLDGPFEVGPWRAAGEAVEDARARQALQVWGGGALAYLVVGVVLARLVRPR